jgi:general secretion pathway protein C
MSPLAAIVLALFADVSVGGAPVAAHHRGGAIKCDATHHCVVARAFVDKLLADTNELATTVRIVPSLVDGKPDGFKLYAMKPGSVWAKLGFANGDTVQTINGMDMSSPEKALEIYTRLRTASDFAVRIVRHGEPLTLTYEIR